MKRILLVVTLVLLALIYVYRQRVFLRDPVATLYRDEVKQDGVQVYINDLSDVLLIKEGDPGGYRILLQAWDRVPGAPVRLNCVHWMACMTEANAAPVVTMTGNGPGTYDPKVIMSDREVSFVDGTGARMRVTLR